MTVCDSCMQLCDGLGPYCDECRTEHEGMLIEIRLERFTAALKYVKSHLETISRGVVNPEEYALGVLIGLERVLVPAPAAQEDESR